MLSLLKERRVYNSNVRRAEGRVSYFDILVAHDDIIWGCHVLQQRNLVINVREAHKGAQDCLGLHPRRLKSTRTTKMNVTVFSSDKRRQLFTISISAFLFHDHLVWYSRPRAGFFHVPLRNRSWGCRQRMWWSLQQATWSQAGQGRRNEKNRSGWWCSKHPEDKQTHYWKQRAISTLISLSNHYCLNLIDW